MAHASKSAPITVRAVLEAAAEITGTPPDVLVCGGHHEPLLTHRRLVQAAALRCGLRLARVVRASGGRVAPKIRRVDAAVEAHAATVVQIAARAREIAATPAGRPVTVRPAAVPAEAVLLATADVCGSRVREIVAPGRAQPALTQRQIAHIAARRLGTPVGPLCRLMGRARHTLCGRPGHMAAVEAAHAATIARVVDAARGLARLPLEALEARMAPPVVALPPGDRATLRRLNAAVSRPRRSPVEPVWGPM